MKILLNRKSPLSLNQSLTLKNRVIVPPMASGSADSLGYVTDKTLDHYYRLTQSGAAMVMVEYSFVHESGRSEENQLAITSSHHIDGLSKLAKIIKSQNILAAIQLTHAGGKSERILTGGILHTPSAIKVPIKDRELEEPEMMNVNDIHLWRQSFIKGAELAFKAGFDLIEFHAAHGYGLNQFLSPYTNRRTDSYGGNLYNRARLLIEIIKSVKQKFPELLISVRMPGQDFTEGGLTQEDAKLLALLLEESGVNILNISSGLGGWRRPGPRVGEGYLVSEAAFIKKHVSIPVIGVGGIETAQYIDEVISQEQISLAAVGRAILSDPINFSNVLLGA